MNAAVCGAPAILCMNQLPSAPLESFASPFYGTQNLPPLRGGRRYNLMMVWNPAVNEVSDFHKLSGYIRKIDPKIRCVIIDSKQSRLAGLLLSAMRPTLVYSPVPLARFRPLRGRLLSGQNLSKAQEYSALERAGFPVPQWQIIRPDEKPDLSGYGPYVVIKPNRGSRGALVKIKKAGRVRYQSGTAATGGGRGRYGPLVSDSTEMLAQHFVYTGQWPVNHRVTTFFGRALHAIRQEASRERNPLPGPDTFGKLPGDKGVSIVATSKGCTMTLTYDEEIIRLGEAAAVAFPEIPLLGIDIVREVPSGKLYILEVNSLGYVWHFSSEAGLRFQKEFGFNLESQFDGMRKAAHILAEKTQELAR